MCRAYVIWRLPVKYQRFDDTTDLSKFLRSFANALVCRTDQVKMGFMSSVGSVVGMDPFTCLLAFTAVADVRRLIKLLTALGFIGRTVKSAVMIRTSFAAVEVAAMGRLGIRTALVLDTGTVLGTVVYGIDRDLFQEETIVQDLSRDS